MWGLERRPALNKANWAQVESSTIGVMFERAGKVRLPNTFARRKGIIFFYLLFFVAGSFSTRAEVSFRREVMAVLSKAGCNAGMCHGNQNGKAEFKLSLRGEDPEFDYNVLTRDAFGRRTNPQEPDRSLILLKPTGQIAHEGGQRFKADSPEFKILREWIAGGLRSDLTDGPRITSLKVTPTEQILMAPKHELPLKVRAQFSDGTESDASSLAVYESANNLATIDHDGVVSLPRAGETTILVRYLEKQAAVRLALVPERTGWKWRAPRPATYIDKLVFRKLEQLRMNPSQLCNDSVYLRRVSLDLLGTLPTGEEARAFVADHRADKRERLVQQLLERPEFADFWALKWSDLLRNEERALDRKGSEAFHHWVRRSIAENKPLDAFAREIVSARGSTYLNPAANFYRANREAAPRAEAIAQLFLGTRLQCAQCHNHPFDRWTQEDYFDWARVFSPVQYKVLENRRQDSNDQHEFKGEQIVYVASKATLKNPRTGEPARPRLLGATPVQPESDPLEAAAAWIASSRQFARAQANRIWFHLMGRGIVDPIDDFRPTNPASNPELLEALTDDFIQHKYDLRWMIETIMRSSVYQFDAQPNESNRDDEANFSHANIRRLAAEQFLDCQSQVLGVAAAFDGYPEGTRATQLAGTRAERKRDHRTSSEQFLDVFGKPPRLLTCECERSNDTTMSQAFQLISGPTISRMLSRPDNRLGTLLKAKKEPGEIVEEFYWAALSRAPAAAELTKGVELLTRSKDQRAALEDIAWALLNSKEFVFRR